MTEPAPPPAGDFRLGEWLVRPDLNRISRGDSTLTLEPKMMQVLVCLAERPGELVSRQDLIEELLSIPSDLSGGLNRPDPVWDHLRDHPLFQALLNKYKARSNVERCNV